MEMAMVRAVVQSRIMPVPKTQEAVSLLQKLLALNITMKV